MRAWIDSLPKAELHVHLEGSVTAETLCEIDPSLTIESARAGYAYADFAGFLQSFAFAAKRLTQPDHYALAARRLFAALERQNVRHVEVILSAGVVLWKGQDLAEVWQALQSVPAPFPVVWNLDAVRQWGVEKAYEVAAMAGSLPRNGAVMSFGLGGDEAGGPARDFGHVYTCARRNGLRLTCHAGETCGPESIWGALEIGAERIGHGIRAIEDPVLVEHLAKHAIPLEISILSNVRTGAVPSLAAHPIRQLFDAGVPVTLNTDDPALFGSCLGDEYEVAWIEFGFNEKELAQIAENGFRYAFNKEKAK